MGAQGTAQRSLVGGWPVALLSLLALVLSLQPFICLLHCAHEDLLRQRGAAHAYQMLCSMSERAGGGEIVAAAPSPSTTASASTSIPAYWPGMLNTWTLALGAFVVAMRMFPSVFHRPASFVALPTTPPPR